MKEQLEKLNKRHERLQLLYQVSNVIHSTLEAQEALQLIVSEAVRLMSASSGSVVLINPTTGLLEISASQNLPSAATKLKLRVGEGVTGWVARHGKPVRVGDVTQEPRYVAARRGVKSELAVPLEVNGETRGVINVDSDRPNAFSAEDQELLEQLAVQAAKVIQNTWLYEQLAVESAFVRVTCQREPHDQFHVESGRGIVRHHARGMRTHARADVFAVDAR